MDTPGQDREGCCRLIRTDGSEWIVTSLEFDGGPPTVDAVRADRDGNGRPSEDRHGPEDAGFPGGAPNENGDGAGNGHLDGEPLSRGDRLEWRGPDGELLWALKNPLH